MIEIILFTAASFVVGLSGALVPGPTLTVTISESIKRGFMAGPLVVSGHMIAEVFLMIAILAGLGWIIGSKTAYFAIGTIGGLVLVFMGYNTARSANKLSHISADTNQRYGSFFGGLITSISNPYFFIWWATIGSAFMFRGLELAGIFGLLGFLLGHWGADFVWYSIVSFFTSKGSKIMNDSTYRVVMKICGAFLIVLGVYFILTVNIFS